MRQDIYRLLAGKGRGDDTELAHITKEESNILKMLGGSGTTNPLTGLPEYNIKKKWGAVIPDWLSPHNTKHDDGTYKNAGGSRHSLKTQEELNIESTQRASTYQGEQLLEEEGSISDMGLGQEALTAEQYQGMTPQQIVDDIFAKQYNGQVPPDMDMSVSEFKVELASKLKNMPQFKGVDPKALGFKQEAKDLAGRRAESTWDATKYGLQGKAGEIAGAMGSGTGVGMRGAIAGQQKIGKGFAAGLESRDIALETADLGYEQGKYGLEQAAGAEWEQDYTGFLGTLPSAA